LPVALVSSVKVADPLQHRAHGHVAQEFLQRAGGVAVDVEHRFVGAQFRDHGAHIAQVQAQGARGVGMDLHARAVEHDGAVDVLGQRPQRRLAVRRAVRRRVVELAVLDAAADAELAASAFRRVVGAEGEMGQLAAQAHAGIVQGAALQGAGEPVAQAFMRGQRQPASDPGDVETVDGAREIGAPGPLPAPSGSRWRPDSEPFRPPWLNSKPSTSTSSWSACG
jgi:hypothetical protein